MAWKRVVLAAGLAALAAGAAGNALAQSTADASLGNLSYRLIDLNPNDGITPSLSLSPNNATGFGGQTDLNGNTISDQSRNTLGTLTYDNNYGRGLIEIQDDLVHVLTQADSGTATGLASRVFNFTLSPNTEVIFSADASVAASSSGARDYGDAEALLFGEIDHGQNTWTYFNSQIQTLQGSEQTVLSVAANTGAGWTHGTIGLLADGFAFSNAQPVPEPASTGMLGCGLGIVAAFLRRRRAVA